MSESKVAVFVSSSDNTRDVLRQVSPSIHKFWPDCPYPIYVGLNTPVASEPFRPVIAEVSIWREELAKQLEQVGAAHIILLLDDFLLLKGVDQHLLGRLVAYAQNHQINYLRLTRLERACIPTLLAGLRNRLKRITVEELPISHPYYASLQIAIWRRDYLLRCLNGSGTIWEFERTVIPGVKHFAVVGQCPLRYEHVVEKGKWLPHASRLVRSAGLPWLPSSRPTWGTYYQIRHVLALIRFKLIGYAWMRARLFLRNASNG